MKTAHGAVHGGRHFRTSLSDWRVRGRSDKTPYDRRGWAEASPTGGGFGALAAGTGTVPTSG